MKVSKYLICDEYLVGDVELKALHIEIVISRLN